MDRQTRAHPFTTPLHIPEDAHHHAPRICIKKGKSSGDTMSFAHPKESSL
jgi:hypothetical protein